MSEASPQQTPLSAFGAAIQGRRSEQQDLFRSVWLSGEQAWLLVVADGMGGHAAGEVASRVAADAFIATFTTERPAGAALGDALQRAMRDANARIAAYQQDAPATTGMGTTLIAVHLCVHGLAWISVGDSPLWVFRNGRVSRLNEDHSLRAAVAAGANANANMLLSALDGGTIALIDCRPKPFRLRSGDLAILASDGLLTLSESEISRIIAENAAAGPELVTRALLRAVETCDKPHQDNCTVIVAAPPKPPATPSSLRWLAAALLVCVVLVTAIGLLAWSWRS